MPWEDYFQRIDEAIKAAKNGQWWLAETDCYESLPDKEAAMVAPVKRLLGLESVIKRC